jgi:hypothetical protein
VLYIFNVYHTTLNSALEVRARRPAAALARAAGRRGVALAAAQLPQAIGAPLLGPRPGPQLSRAAA